LIPDRKRVSFDFVSASQPSEAQNAVHSNMSGLGQFPPYTRAERELEAMLRAKDESMDLALANWLIAEDIPQFGDTSRKAFFASLDAMTERVRQEISKMQSCGWRGADPKNPGWRCRLFCNAIIKLGFQYREEFRSEDLTAKQLKALYSEADNIFLAGLLRSRSGSCVSMPLIYLVLAQRLGFPVYLVTVGKHYFVRWEEPGYRMNIEPTIVDKVAVTPDDSVYLGIEGMTASQLRGNQMRNLTNREQCLDLSRARHLAPDDPGIESTHSAVFAFYGIKPEHTSIEIKLKPKQ
jgi:hypothetical protein